jgi:hypothetical protein
MSAVQYDEFLNLLKVKYPHRRILDFAIEECLHGKTISTEFFMEYVKRRVKTTRIREDVLETWLQTIGTVDNIEFLKCFLKEYPEMLTEARVKKMFFFSLPISEPVASYLFSLDNIHIDATVMMGIVVYPNILRGRLESGWRMGTNVELCRALDLCLRQDNRDSFRLILEHHEMNGFGEIAVRILDDMNISDVEIMEQCKPRLLTNTIKVNYISSRYERMRIPKVSKMTARFIREVQNLDPILAENILRCSLYRGVEDIALIIIDRFPQTINIAMIEATLDNFTMIFKNENVYDDRYMKLDEYDRVFTFMIQQARAHTTILDDFTRERIIRPSLNLIKKASRDGNPRACEILIEHAGRNPRDSRSAWIRWAGKKAQYEMIDRLIRTFPQTEHAQALQWASGQKRDPKNGTIVRFNTDVVSISKLFMVLSSSKSIRQVSTGPYNLMGIIEAIDYPDIKSRVEAGHVELLGREREFICSLVTVQAYNRATTDEMMRTIIEYTHSEETLFLKVLAYYGERIPRLIKLLNRTHSILTERNIRILKRRTGHDDNLQAIMDIVSEVQEYEE